MVILMKDHIQRYCTNRPESMELQRQNKKWEIRWRFGRKIHAQYDLPVYESSPWSNNSPNGPDKPMRLACLPSMPSNVYARKIFTAAINQNQFGIGVVPPYPVLESKPQSYHDNMIKFSAVNKKPTNVIRFGAIHRGKNCFCLFEGDE